MALANFFDKALLSASQVLKGFDIAAFEARLTEHRIAIAFDSTAMSDEGGAALDMTLRLVARLYPSVAIVSLGKGLPEETKYHRLLKSINPNIDIASTLTGATACVVVGNTRVDGPPAFYVGSDNWLALLSTKEPVGSGVSGNPFGAGAAACLAAANVFRFVFRDEIDGAEADSDLRVSLLSYEVGDGAEPGPAWQAINLGESYLVGVGAIGNGAAWSLANAKEVSGILQIIDHESVERTNLQRYVLMDQSDIGKPKVKRIVRFFKQSRLQVRGQPFRWGEYVRRRGDWRLQRVAVALDTARDRVALQGALPKRIFNSWTQLGDLGVSRHLSFGQDRPCLACLYHPTGKAPDQDELIAQAIGMPELERRMALREMLYRGSPVGVEFVAEVASRLNVAAEGLMPFAHLPLSSFYTEAVCGGAVFRLSEGATSRPTEVPLAFQSALAGVMLAAELVIDSADLRVGALPDRTVVNVLRRFPKLPSYPHPKRDGCICSDDVYVDAYSAKYQQTHE